MLGILHINIYIFPILLLGILYVSMRRDIIQSTERRLFRLLLLFTFFLLVTELLSWEVDGLLSPLARALGWIFNLVYLALTPLVSLLWITYIFYFINGKPLLRCVRVATRILLFLPTAVYELLLLSSPFTGLLFTLTELNRYRRGPLFAAPYIIVFLYTVTAVALTFGALLRDWHNIRRKNYVFLCVFTLLPIAACLIQMLFPAVWIAYPGTALAELLLYVHMQRQNITTDALTGLNNRGCMNRYLKDHLPDDAANPLCLLMLDLDHFKQINDTLGHRTGDIALIRAANLLSVFFHRTGSFLARYGGDEFCVITRLADGGAAGDLIVRLQAFFAQDNILHPASYTLSISGGYALSERSCPLSPEELISRADEIMYADKERRRGT